MENSIKQLVEENLKVIYLSKDQCISKNEFVNVKGNQLNIDQIEELINVLDHQDLIEIEEEKVYLSNYAYKIIESGEYDINIKLPQEEGEANYYEEPKSSSKQIITIIIGIFLAVIAFLIFNRVTESKAQKLIENVTPNKTVDK